MNALSRLFAFVRCLALLGLFLGAVSPALAAKTYSDNGDGTVTDPTTGLVWMRCSMGQTWDGTTCTGTASTYTWDQANALTGTVTFAGQSDWRVPNIRELLTIVDRTVFNPAIDVVVFPATPSSSFWSGSPNAYYSVYAWDVHFYDGGPGGGGRSSSGSVRLVRGGQSLGLLDITRPSTDYVDQSDGSVLHTPTRLIWQRCAVGQSWTGSTCSGTAAAFNWDAAKALKSNFAGQTDWRLPAKDELFSLLDYSKSFSSINATLFPSTSSSSFWSDSPGASSLDNAWSINFTFGDAYAGYRGNAYFVRLVRGGQCFGHLALGISQTGAGQIASSLHQSIDTAVACDAVSGATGYSAGDVVTLTATPAVNLIAWGGACASAGTTPTCTVTMDAAKSVTASFKDTSLITGLPAALTFTTQNIASTSAAQTITLTNTGNAALNINSLTASSDFAVTNNCGAGIGAGGFCMLNVTFKPTASGTRTGTLTLTSDAPGSPHNTNLTGTGQGAVASLSATSKTFSSQNQGTTSAAQTITLSNTGGAVLNISGIVVTGDFAKTTTCGTTLATATNCTISVTFAPTSVGTLTGSLVITSDSASSPDTIALSGTGSAVPVLSLSSPALSFPETSVSSSSAVQTVKLTNAGAAALTLTSIAASGDFAVTNNCGSGLGAAGFCNLSVTFIPTAAGNRVGTITITSNAPGSPHTMALSGSTPAPISTSLGLLQGWNLLGNGQDQPLPIAALFGDIQNVTTVWKWDVTLPGWQFYAPSMDAAALQTYATSKGYGVLSTVNPGEGFWVNAVQPFTVAPPSGTAITGNDFLAGKPYALKLGWNLVAVGTVLTPSAFNIGLSATPPAVGTVPINLTTLWAWDNPQGKWYFYAPNLEGQGGTALTDYVTGKGYLDFTANSKRLGPGVGFWVNKP